MPSMEVLFTGLSNTFLSTLPFARLIIWNDYELRTTYKRRKTLCSSRRLRASRNLRVLRAPRVPRVDTTVDGPTTFWPYHFTTFLFHPFLFLFLDRVQTTAPPLVP
jgi:hypothetical protein